MCILIPGSSSKYYHVGGTKHKVILFYLIVAKYAHLSLVGIWDFHGYSILVSVKVKMVSDLVFGVWIKLGNQTLFPMTLESLIFLFAFFFFSLFWTSTASKMIKYAYWCSFRIQDKIHLFSALTWWEQYCGCKLNLRLFGFRVEFRQLLGNALKSSFLIK